MPKVPQQPSDRDPKTFLSLLNVLLLMTALVSVAGLWKMSQAA